MNRLQQTQSDFRNYLLRQSAHMESQVVGNERANAATRLGIYAGAYRGRLIEALDANYPAVHAWLGDDEFDELGRAYVDAEPSRHYSIRWFGHRLPQFVAGVTPWRDSPFLGELATFEWAMSEIFDAADGETIAPERLAALPPADWPGMRLTLHPSLRELTLRWNVAPIWRALTHDETAETPTQSQSPKVWIAWRQAYALYYRELEVDEAWALSATRERQSFSELCEGLCQWVDAEQVAVRAVGFLRQWIDDGLIVGLET